MSARQITFEGAYSSQHKAKKHRPALSTGPAAAAPTRVSVRPQQEVFSSFAGSSEAKEKFELPLPLGYQEVSFTMAEWLRMVHRQPRD